MSEKEKIHYLFLMTLIMNLFTPDDHQRKKKNLKILFCKILKIK